MDQFDLIVKGGMVATAAEVFRADVGIKDGRIAALGERLSGGRILDADGLLVLPGGVDTHCHIEQLEPDGSIHEESFATASASAFAGGTTSIICFASQVRGTPLRETLADYHRRAATSMIDYGLHQMITDPTEEVLRHDVPEIVAAGVRSLKVFLTYDPLHLDDRQFLSVLAAARRNKALVTVHAENYEAIRYRTEALLFAGHTDPRFHAVSRPEVVEREATYRAIALAELMDQAIQIFHVSSPEVAEEIARAQARGVKVWAETCPQYLTLTAEDLNRPGFEGAKFMCSPALRDTAAQSGLWQMIRRGVIDVVSSDHCGFSFGGSSGKAVAGVGAPFDVVPNGIPGLAARLPLLFSEGVSKGRIGLTDFVRLTASNPARLMGLAPMKGTLAPGADADLVLWDPNRKVRLTNAMMHHAIDYTPYEGHEVTGWPVATIARGSLVMQDGKVNSEPGHGRFLPRQSYEFIQPRGVVPDGFDMSQAIL